MRTFQPAAFGLTFALGYLTVLVAAYRASTRLTVLGLGLMLASTLVAIYFAASAALESGDAVFGVHGYLPVLGIWRKTILIGCAAPYAPPDLPGRRFGFGLGVMFVGAVVTLLRPQFATLRVDRSIMVGRAGELHVILSADKGRAGMHLFDSSTEAFCASFTVSDTSVSLALYDKKRPLGGLLERIRMPCRRHLLDSPSEQDEAT